MLRVWVLKLLALLYRFLQALLAVFREYGRNLRLFSRNARLLLLGTFLGSLGMGMVWVLRNLYLRRMGFDDSQIGNVLAAAATGLVAVAPLALKMDRSPLKPFLLLAGIVGAIGVTGQLHTENLRLIFAAAFLSGVGGSLAGIAAVPFVMRNTGPSERVYLFGVWIATATLGAFLSMWISGRYTYYWGDTAVVLRWVMTGGAALACLGVIPFLMIREAPIDRKKDPAGGRRGRDWRTIGKLCLPDMLIGAGAGLTIPFINLYFETRFHASSSRIANYYALSQLLNILGFLGAPVMARAMGLVRSVVVSQLLSIPFFAVLAVTTDLRLAVGAFLLRNMLMNMVQPVNSNFSMEAIPEDQRAVTNCLKGLAWNAPWIPAASFGGWVVHHFREIWAKLPWGHVDPARFFVQDGFSLTMYVTIALYFVSASVFYVFFRNFRVAPKVETPIVKPEPVVAGGPDGE